MNAARRMLAEALSAIGDRAGAIEQLQVSLGTAKERGIAYEARLAREGLAALGGQSDLPTPDSVRAILERLDNASGDMRARLAGLIDDLVAAGGRESEAGMILRDYYVKKIGSLAERHYITRRLHLGWELLASRLGPLDEFPVGSARDSRVRRGWATGRPRPAPRPGSPGGPGAEDEEEHGRRLIVAGPGGSPLSSGEEQGLGSARSASRVSLVMSAAPAHPVRALRHGRSRREAPAVTGTANRSGVARGVPRTDPRDNAGSGVAGWRVRRSAGPSRAPIARAASGTASGPLDPAAFGDGLAVRIEQPAAGIHKLGGRMPGEHRQREREQRLQEGLELLRGLVVELREAAGVGLDDRS